MAFLRPASVLVAAGPKIAPLVRLTRTALTGSVSVCDTP
jgi:hypothetical protein